MCAFGFGLFTCVTWSTVVLRHFCMSPWILAPYGLPWILWIYASGYLHLFICIHMCYSHVLSGWNALMSVFIYVHVFTCVRMCYSHVLAKRNALMDVLVGKWALNLFLSFTCFTCSVEVSYIKWNAPINASRWMDLFMNNIASFRSLTYAHANFFKYDRFRRWHRIIIKAPAIS